MAFFLLLLSAPFAGAAFLSFGSGTGAQVTAGAETMRTHLVPADEAPAQTQVDVRLGWLPLTLGRLVVSLTPAPREAGLALQSVREADVAVYQWNPNREFTAPKPDLAALDSTLERQGWNRVVQVQEGLQSVLVYVANNSRMERDLTACVAVSDRDQLVIAGGRFDLEALAELVHGVSARSPGPRPNWTSPIAGHFGGIHGVGRGSTSR